LLHKFCNNVKIHETVENGGIQFQGVLMAKYKHLTINERHDIEQCLNKQHSFKEIGRMLNRDPTTIS